MRPIIVTVGPLAAAAANNIATSQMPAAAFTLNGALVAGGVAVLDTPRRVRITTGGSESGKTATITGTSFSGQAATDTLTLPGSATTVDSVVDFKTVTSITVSSALAANATVGTNTVAGSEWTYLDAWSWPNVAIQCTVSGTVNYTVQSTLDDPNDPTNPVTIPNVTWVSSGDSAVVAATATKQSNFFFLPRYVRVLLNSSTSPGYVQTTILQSGGVQL